MSKKITLEPQREILFDIDREARKHYPENKGSQPSKNACIQTFSYNRARKAPGVANRGVYSSH
jgi:hypothetical protein